MTDDRQTYHGLGRRKSAVARVMLTQDPLERTVNGIPLQEYFPIVAMHQSALAPLVLTTTDEKYGLRAIVTGGGKHAQADAVKLGVARALLEINSDWRKQLKTAHMLTRDPRAKERKKFGLKRARRAPQFSKR